MIGYATVGTNDIDRARGFYDALFGSIGARRMMEFPENGFTMYGTARDRPAVAVTRPYNEQGQPRPATALWSRSSMDSRDKVDALLRQGARARRHRRRTAWTSQARKATEAFYGAYFRDLDGNKFCAFRIGPGDQRAAGKARHARSSARPRPRRSGPARSPRIALQRLEPPARLVDRLEGELEGAPVHAERREPDPAFRRSRTASSGLTWLVFMKSRGS